MLSNGMEKNLVYNTVVNRARADKYIVIGGTYIGREPFYRHHINVIIVGSAGGFVVDVIPFPIAKPFEIDRRITSDRYYLKP